MNSNFNCYSYAMTRTGFLDKEQAVSMEAVQQYLALHFKSAKEIDADIIAVLGNKGNSIYHMAAFDQKNRKYVWERAGMGRPIRKVLFQKAIVSVYGLPGKYIKYAYYKR